MRASNKGNPLRNRYFTTISSSSVITVADRHILAAYYNKQCKKPMQSCQCDSVDSLNFKFLLMRLVPVLYVIVQSLLRKL